jgi:hypothetical protein
VVAEICGDRRPRWELPLRLFGGVHYLALSGQVPDAWDSFGATLRTHREWLTSFVAEQPIQTNEVQRSWGLLPAFLSVADGRPVDLIELGPSAGLNLLWDRYRYVYGDAAWGDPAAPLELTGDCDGCPRPELFDRTVNVRGRIGIDRTPVDLRSDESVLLLASFVWADQEHRLARLRAAIEVARKDPPHIVAGDYVRELPRLLAERDTEALTIVFHSVSLAYLARDERDRLLAAIAEDGVRGSLVHVSFEFDEEDRRAYEGFGLDVQVFPDGEPVRLARLDGHANRLRWSA